jgi:CrcB protein
VETAVPSAALSLRHVGLVFVGGAIGAGLRVLVAAALPIAVGGFPWTTFVVNVVGAFLLAGLITVFAGRRRLDRTTRVLIGTGILGAVTTYSTLSVEVVRLIERGDVGLATAYAVGSVVIGVVAAWAGIRVGRRLASRRLARTPQVGR